MSSKKSPQKNTNLISNITEELPLKLLKTYDNHHS